MENEILDVGTDVSPAAERSVKRALGARYDAYLEEVQKLLRAGLAEITEKGSVEPRVADIVRRAGLSNKAFYRHFRSKEELLLAILEEGMRARMRGFDERLARAGSASERVRVWIRTILDQAMNARFAELTRPLLVYQARLAESLGEQLWGHRDHLRAPLREALAAGRESGEFPGCDPDADSETIYFLATGYMHGRVIERRVMSDAEADGIVEFALAALQRRADVAAQVREGACETP